MNPRRAFAAALLGLVAAASAAGAQSGQAAIGSGGEVYQVRLGSKGALFAGVDAASRDYPVLALDVTAAGAAPRRVLVPGTDGPEVESSPALVFDEPSGTVFLVWQTRVNLIHSLLQLSSFDGKVWAPRVELSGNVFFDKTATQIVVTRDTFSALDADGIARTHARAILHLLWSEESPDSDLTFYTPVILIDGRYLGWNPVYLLNLLDAADPSGAETEPTLARAPRLQTGRDGRTVIVGLASMTTGRLVTVEIDCLPFQVGQLADDARAHIVDIGAAAAPADVRVVADKARAHIVDIGVAFQPAIAKSIGDVVHGVILESGLPAAGGITALGDKARAHIIDIGAKLSGRGLRPTGAAPDVARIEEIRPARDADVGDDTAHLLQFRLVSSRPSPRLAAKASAVQLFLSDTAGEILVSWRDGERLFYRESKGAGWTDRREIKLGDTIDLDRAYEILERQARSR